MLKAELFISVIIGPVATEPLFKFCHIFKSERDGKAIICPQFLGDSWIFILIFQLLESLGH